MVDYKYSELYKQESIDKQMNIAFDGGNITNDDIHSEQFELTESLCSESQLRFGSCEASMIKFRISNIFTPLKDKWLTVTETLNHNTDIPFQFGKYKVYSDKLTADRRYRDVVAYDSMYDIINADVTDWYNNLIFPMTLLAFRNSFFSYLSSIGISVVQESISLVNDETEVIKGIEVTTLSGKAVINSICEINGVFGHINNHCMFTYVSVSNTPIADIDVYIPPLEYEDYEVASISGIQIRTEENDIGVSVGTDTNKYIVQGNFLCYGKSEDNLRAIANNLLEKIQGITYVPTKFKTYGNPCIEVGDCVSIQFDNGNTIKSIITERTLSGVQALFDNFVSNGTETQTQDNISIMDTIQSIQGQTNKLSRTLTENVSEILDKTNGLSNRITQNSNSLSSEIARALEAENLISSRIEQTENGLKVTNTAVEGLQRQVDGTIKYYGDLEEEPTLTNYPATEFCTYRKYGDGIDFQGKFGVFTDEIYRKYIGTKAFMRDGSKSWTFSMNENGAYYWREITGTIEAQLSARISDLEFTSEQYSLHFERLDATVTQDGGKITELQTTVKTQAGEINSKVSKGSIVSEINQNPDEILINANKVSIIGNTTFDSIFAEGTTAIDGGKIATYSIGANQIKTDELIIGKNIAMSEDATISWDKINSKPDDLAYTGNIPTKLSELYNDEEFQNYNDVTIIARSEISSAKINANQMTTGILKSINYIEDEAGMYLDLDNGNLEVNGDSTFVWKNKIPNILGIPDVKDEVLVELMQEGLSLVLYSNSTWSTKITPRGIKVDGVSVVEGQGQTFPLIKNVGDVTTYDDISLRSLNSFVRSNVVSQSWTAGVYTYSYAKCGNVVHANISVKVTSLNAGVSTESATLSNLPTPAKGILAASYAGNRALILNLLTDKSVSMRNASTTTLGKSTIGFGFAYICE